MTSTLFQPAADIAVAVANDIPAGAVRASVHHLPPVSAIVAQRNGSNETMLFVEEGMVELAINGVDGYLTQGEFARIAPQAHYAFRNKSAIAARVLSVPVVRAERTFRVISNDAA